MIEGIPAQVVEVLGRTGMRGEASSVKVRVLDGNDRGSYYCAHDCELERQHHHRSPIVGDSA